MVSYDDFESLIIVLIFGVLGIIVAMIVNTLNTSGTVINEFVTGTITITDLIAGIIILFLIIGVVIAAVKR